MGNAFVETINMMKMISLIQIVLFFVLAIVFNFKIKNILTTFKQMVNGLAGRIDREFDEYKEKNKIETDALKEQLYKLEGQMELLHKNKISE